MQRSRERWTPYWGKIAGATAGLATGRLWLALIGLILGHQFDRGFSGRSRRGKDDEKHVPAEFARSLFQTMGFLAKVDGRVSEEEIRAARVTMHRLGLGPGEIRQSIEWFEQGKLPSFALHECVRQVRRETARHTELRSLFVRLLLEVALSKKSLDRRERAAIWTICSELDISRVELAQLEAMLRAQKGFRRPAGAAEADRLTSAYEVLGVDRSSTNEQIKKAYRRLMNKNHPDKLAAGGDAVLAKAAARRTREIRSAYETLKARRSIR